MGFFDWFKNKKEENKFRKNDDIIFKEKQKQKYDDLDDKARRKSEKKVHKAQQNIKVMKMKEGKPKVVKNNNYNIENNNAVNQFNTEASLFTKKESAPMSKPTPKPKPKSKAKSKSSSKSKKKK